MAALAESAVLCAVIHDPPDLSVSGFSFARPTLHTSGIHAVRRLKVKEKEKRGGGIVKFF
jgi:hypothetical protein